LTRGDRIKKMKKSQKILWVLTIINSTLIFFFLFLIVLYYIFPLPSYEEELRKWVTEQNKATIEDVRNANKELTDYVNSEVQRLYDFGNKNWR